MGRELTAKQEAFCHEYMVDLNATQAALRAGYSEKTAYATGFENLKKPEIMDRIASMAAERCAETDINSKMVLDGIRAIAVNPKARHNDQLKAWELLGKYLKLFSEGQTIKIPEDYTFTMVVHGEKDA